jgi:hypothetical protein
MNEQDRDPIEAPPNVTPSERTDTDYSPSSERETEALQDDQDSAVFDDPDIDRDAVKVLPGTGDYTDDGDVDVDPGEVHMPRLPGRTEAGPPSDRRS